MNKKIIHQKNFPVKSKNKKRKIIKGERFGKPPRNRQFLQFYGNLVRIETSVNKSGFEPEGEQSWKKKCGIM